MYIASGPSASDIYIFRGNQDKKVAKLLEFEVRLSAGPSQIFSLVL